MDTLKNVYENSFNSIDEIMKKYGNTNLTQEDYPKEWKGFRELVLVDRVQECEDIVSFYFKSKDGKKLINHKPGQYLPIKIKTNDPKYKEEIRTYSLSMKPNEHIYRISVKKVLGGLISTYLHENLKVGDIVNAMMPTGIFTLKDADKDRNIVLISAGIGITPVLSMLYEGVNTFENIYFIQAVQNSKIQPFGYDVEKIREESSLKSYVFYSNPLDEDIQGKDYDFTGYINKEWIKDNLPLDAEFYFCGPPPFMKILNKSLKELGVKKENINFEFFGKPEDME